VKWYTPLIPKSSKALPEGGGPGAREALTEDSHSYDSGRCQIGLGEDGGLARGGM
jgi:hypothetical protein